MICSLYECQCYNKDALGCGYDPTHKTGDTSKILKCNKIGQKKIYKKYLGPDLVRICKEPFRSDLEFP